MQTGAFLQLVLSLSALTCRLRALSQILLEIHEELVGALRDLSSSLDVRMIVCCLADRSTEPSLQAFHKLNHESKNMSSYADAVPAMSSVPITVSDTGGYQSVTFTAKSGNSEQRSVGKSLFLKKTQPPAHFSDQRSIRFISEFESQKPRAKEGDGCERQT